jgi:nicotinamide-nucleotide amidase
LRIVAEGDSEDACRAQIEPTVAEIHQCLGTLVYGEGDDELQDVVIRILRQRGQTLASAEIATRGLTAQWLAKAGGGDRPYRGGLVAADEAAISRLLPISVSSSADAGAAFVREMAISCRERFQSDFGLAIGPLPASAGGEAGHVHFALASAAGERTLRLSSGIHPDIVADYLAKHAINLLRLELL